jgi:flagellar biosynthesis protein FlhG
MAKNKFNPIIIPVASGKGGVGKTILAINLSYALAQFGKSVILIDMDFGGANIHTCLGYDTAPDGIGNFLNQKKSSLSDYILSTNDKNLRFIPGDAEMVWIANITISHKKKLIGQINALDADFVVLDLGAGSANNTIDFFMISNFGLLVAMPEITSILNAYAFLKNTIFRLLFLNLKKYSETRDIFAKHSARGGESAWKLSELIEKLSNVDPEIAAKAVGYLDNLNPKIIINMAYKPKDLAMGEKLRKISKNYINIDMEYAGFIYRDKIIEQSVAERKPLAVIAPHSSTYQTIVKIAYKIMSANKNAKFLLDIDNYDDSFEIVMEEATEDLISRIEGYEQLAGENLITVNELLSIVKNLEYENIGLKKKIELLETQALKTKK